MEDKSQMNTPITLLTVMDLFTSPDSYEIPCYQRGYDWGETEIQTLIDDVRYAKGTYYLGNLIVKKSKDGEGRYEVIDGQQRLITLQLIAACVEQNPCKLFVSFEIRDSCNSFLESLCKHDKVCQPEDKLSRILYDRYQDIKQINLNYKEFLTKMENIKLLRVEVPENTDLNRYFEIMNSRGIQLEDHEIVKARLLSFMESGQDFFGKIWDAISDMNGYVLLNLKHLVPDVFYFLSERVEGTNVFQIKKRFEKEILGGNGKSEEKKDVNLEDVLDGVALKNLPDSDSDFVEERREHRFDSVIPFPDFLMIALRIIQKEDIVLDARQLLPKFDDLLKSIPDDGKESFAQDFIWKLLRLRFYFDSFIIKYDDRKNQGTRYEKKGWFIQAFAFQSDKIYFVAPPFVEEQKIKALEILESMFDVSYPASRYKAWLYGALQWLFLKSENCDVFSSDVISGFAMYMENMATAFLFQRYLSSGPKDLSEIADEDESFLLQHSEQPVCWDNLDQGIGVETFVFNYLDYLLWMDFERNKDDFLRTYGFGIMDSEASSFFENYRFTIRTSVEHYFARNLEEDTPLKLLDKFGNLSLLRRDTNSTLGKMNPEDKNRRYSYVEGQGIKYQSIKQVLMSATYAGEEEWKETGIEQHEEQMIAVFQRKMDSHE